MNSTYTLESFEHFLKENRPHSLAAGGNFTEIPVTGFTDMSYQEFSALMAAAKYIKAADLSFYTRQQGSYGQFSRNLILGLVNLQNLNLRQRMHFVTFCQNPGDTARMRERAECLEKEYQGMLKVLPDVVRVLEHPAKYRPELAGRAKDCIRDFNECRSRILNYRSYIKYLAYEEAAGS